MPRTIVCGVDTSEAAPVVAGAARRLADGLDADLIVLHVTEEGEAPLEGVEDVRVVEGSPAERLLEAVQLDDAELLVVGSRGGPIYMSSTTPRRPPREGFHCHMSTMWPSV